MNMAGVYMQGLKDFAKAEAEPSYLCKIATRSRFIFKIPSSAAIYSRSLSQNSESGCFLVPGKGSECISGLLRLENRGVYP